MPASKHTPGEWEARRPIGNTGNIEIYAHDNLIAIATCKDWGYGCESSREETRANAQLFAAAARMLEALTLAQKALNTAPRFRVGDTDSYKIAATVDMALAAAVPVASRRPESLPSPAEILADPTPYLPEPGNGNDQGNGR